MTFFANNNINIPKNKPLYTTQKKFQEKSYTQHIPKAVSQSAFFNEKRKFQKKIKKQTLYKKSTTLF